MRSRLPALATTALVIALLGACSGSGPEVGSADAGAKSDSAAAGSAEAADAGGSGADENREIVTVGSLTLVTPDVTGAAQEVAELAEAAGGRVESRSESNDEDSEPRAELTIRVPAAATSATLSAFDDLGTVRNTDIQATDVTGTARDLDARISALRTSATRLESLMAEATTTADLLAAENELTSRQAELESLQAERALLADQVSMSTLTISIVKTETTEPAEATGFLGALSTGWSALVTAAKTVVYAVGLFLPWAVPAAVIWLAVRWWLRRHRRHAGYPPAAPDTMTTSSDGPPPTAPPMP